MFPHLKFTETQIREHLQQTTVDAVSSILKEKQKLNYFDFISLLSPAATEVIKLMRVRAQKEREAHFGKTVRFYAPIYFSNYCVNECVYCGFRASNEKEIRRRTNIEEILADAHILKSQKIDSIVLVSGEDIKVSNIPFLVELTQKLREIFSYISIEIQPMNEEQYHALLTSGIHGLTIYQETYQQDLYKQLHLKGPKKDYQHRLDCMEEGAKAGFYQLGIGALLGLYDWRIESASIAAHGLYLMKHYWRSKVNFSFPRITPMAGGYHPPAMLNEQELEQMMLAFRIFFPDNDIYLSTRESPDFRDQLAKTAATVISAGSRVAPGAYVDTNEDNLDQFTMNDTRSVAVMEKTYKTLGLEVIYKDWDNHFGI